jgi:hypothetical protein
MIVEEIAFQLALQQDPDRSPGTHLSDVIRDMAFQSGILDPKWDTEELDAVVVGLGVAWEEWVVKQHSEIVFHPGEFVMDGIAMSPDGVSVHDGDITITGIEEGHCRVHEFKYTRKSSRDAASQLEQGTKFWLWIVQIKSYCHAIASREAYLHVLFANGDYGTNAKPEYRIFRLTFTEAELQENWDMITRHNQRMEAGGGRKANGVWAAVPRKKR